MSLINQKREYLTKVYDIKFPPKIKTNHIVNCELCGTKLILNVSGLTSLSVSKGEFHHDQNGVLHLYCYYCHRRIHDWGTIQRWLEKIDKTVEALPDSIGTKSMRKNIGPLEYVRLGTEDLKAKVMKSIR